MNGRDWDTALSKGGVLKVETTRGLETAIFCITRIYPHMVRVSPLREIWKSRTGNRRGANWWQIAGKAKLWDIKILVELRGIEPLTS